MASRKEAAFIGEPQDRESRFELLTGILACRSITLHRVDELCLSGLDAESLKGLSARFEVLLVHLRPKSVRSSLSAEIDALGRARESDPKFRSPRLQVFGFTAEPMLSSSAFIERRRAALDGVLYVPLTSRPATEDDINHQLDMQLRATDVLGAGQR